MTEAIQLQDVPMQDLIRFLAKSRQGSGLTDHVLQEWLRQRNIIESIEEARHIIHSAIRCTSQLEEVPVLQIALNLDNVHTNTNLTQRREFVLRETQYKHSPRTLIRHELKAINKTAQIIAQQGVINLRLEVYVKKPDASTAVRLRQLASDLIRIANEIDQLLSS